MGKWVHQAFLGVNPPSVDELGRHSCADIRHIPTWFLLTHYWIRWSSALVAACFLRTYSVPSCRLSRCALSNRSCTTGCFCCQQNWMFCVLIEIPMLQSNFHSNCSFFLYEYWQFDRSRGFWDLSAVCFRLRIFREAFVLSKPKKNVFWFVDLVSFERSRLLRLEPQ